LVVLPTYIKEEVEQAVQVALIDLFEASDDRFGVGIAASDIIAVIDNTRGVKRVDVSCLHTAPKMRKMVGRDDVFSAVSATLTVLSGNVFADDEVYVEWVNSLQYRLRSRDYGLFVDAAGKVQTFTSGTSYTLIKFTGASGQTIPVYREVLQIQLTVSANPALRPSSGSRYRFQLPTYYGNMSCAEYEIIAPTIVSVGPDTRRLSATEWVFTVTGGIGG
jgi:hypothetical protein